MEQLRAELSHLLGEKLSRIECVNEKADTALWSLYDSHGNPMPLMARSFTTPGVAQQLAWKITMLARSAVGARLTGYNTWLTGPREADNVDGPEEFHLVIVDNGRSQVLGSEFRDVLRCIRCGACMNTCPAYRHIGGHGYGSIYPGPIGAVISPLLGGYKDFKDLPYACSLCTACDSVCPVKIPLSKLILRHRRVMAEEGITPKAERRAIKMFAYANSHPGLWKVGMMAGAHAASWFINGGKTPLKVGAIGDWMEARDLPNADGESYRSWFKKHQAQEKKNG